MKKIIGFFCFLWLWGIVGAVGPFVSPGEFRRLSQNQQVDCSYTLNGEWIEVEPSCLLEGRIPQFSLIEKIDFVMPFLETWGSGYQPDQHFAVYSSESLAIAEKEGIFPLDQDLQNRLFEAKSQGKRVVIEARKFAPEVIQDLAFFGSEKETAMMGPCTKHNYLLAFSNLDGKVIQPGEHFNFNNYLIKLRGYCRGLGNNDFLFYGGVCGAASQLFRAGLSSPQVTVDQRFGHNNWYAKYYGDVVEGDDAAVYERSKWFSFTNHGTAPLVIKTIQKGTLTYLFFITEAKAISNQWVEINKVRKSPLEVELFKTVYQNRGQGAIHCASGLGKLGQVQSFDCGESMGTQVIGEQSFVSRYISIDKGDF